MDRPQPPSELTSIEGALARVRVVLVEPRYDGNLGQVARAMRNFGLRKLVLVRGEADPASDEAGWFGRGEGAPILRAAQRVATLDEALVGCRTVIATSRRLGRKRGPALTPHECFEETRPFEREWDSAILFGREAHGLFTDEIERATDLLYIPSDPGCPSLNLAHAVAVVGFALSETTRRALGREPEMPEIVPADDASTNALFEHARRVWLRIGYLHYQNPDSILRQWRRLLSRSRITEHEVRIVRALVHQIDWVARVAGIPQGGVQEAPEGLFDKHRAFPGEETKRRGSGTRVDPPPASVTALAEVHRHLGGLFDAHREALVERDLPSARARLAVWLAGQQRHVDDEESHVFPLLEGEARIEGAPPEMLLAEHRRILEGARALAGRLEALAEELGDEAPSPAAVLPLLDEGAQLRRLVTHHEAREESLVFPALDGALDEAARAALIEATWRPPSIGG